MSITKLGLYRGLLANMPAILDDARKVAADVGISADRQGSIGLTGGGSARPGILKQDVVQSITESARQAEPLNVLGDEIRDVVKTVYGDEYDAAPVASCEGGLSVSYEALVAPPLMGRGTPYHVRCISPLERHAEHQLSYGRPFPPRYKDIFADRGATAGELGLAGRRIENLDMIMVPAAGASYAVHGIKHYPCPLFLETDSHATLTSCERVAERHAAMLGGVVSLGYDTPGYGYSQQGDDGVPDLQRGLAKLAHAYGVPYIVDNAWGMPFVGANPRGIGADIMLYSMDKVAWAPTCGLIIGREAELAQVRRALGIHSERWGTTSAHGKGALVALDPGREAMAGLLAALRILRDQPERVTRPIDITYEIVLEEYNRTKGQLGDRLLITKSYNSGGVEVNYERTWTTERMGIPIFSHEDRLANVNLVNRCMAEMGVVPGLPDDANVLITPGLGTVDTSGTLDEDAMRIAVRAFFRALEIVARWGDHLASN